MLKKNRKLKVYYGHQKGRKERRGWYESSDYVEVPTIILKGHWLDELGFSVGQKIDVACENGRLTISVDKA